MSVQVTLGFAMFGPVRKR